MKYIVCNSETAVLNRMYDEFEKNLEDGAVICLPENIINTQFTNRMIDDNQTGKYRYKHVIMLGQREFADIDIEEKFGLYRYARHELFKKLDVEAKNIYYPEALNSDECDEDLNNYKEVLEEMETEGNHYQNIESLELKEIEKEEFIKTLDGEIYTLPSYRRNYIIQRLNSFVSDGAVKFNGKIFTIEHVLPQNPRMDSQWLAVWSEADRKIWVNKIANLVALTRQHNSQAQNYDFEEKKQKSNRNNNPKYIITWLWFFL